MDHPVPDRVINRYVLVLVVVLVLERSARMAWSTVEKGPPRNQSGGARLQNGSRGSPEMHAWSLSNHASSPKTPRLVRRSLCRSWATGWSLFGEVGAVAQLVTESRTRTTTRTSTIMGRPYGKQRLIASSNGFTVSTVSSPIFETRKLLPLIFP